MSKLPPKFTSQLFKELDKPKSDIIRIFTPFVIKLVSYLNGLSCLSDIQHIRKMNGRTTRQLGTAFNQRINDIYPGHWYIYNWGGRNEMQFNIGMYSNNDPATPYVRIGVGFNFDRAKFGDPPKVARAFSSFVNKVVSNRKSFEYFYDSQSLDIEFLDVDASSIVQWLQREARKNPDEHEWVFIGRQLHRTEDKIILEDPVLLNKVIESVFSGLKQYY
jgi:hypothetical protein